MEFYLLDTDYVIVGDTPILRLYGINKNNSIVLYEYSKFRPYFFVSIKKEYENNKNKIEELKRRVKELYYKGREGIYRVLDIKEEYHKILGEKRKVLKITCNIPPAVKKFREELKNFEEVEDDYESDIPFYRRFLIDKNLKPTILYKVKEDGELEELNEFLTIDKVKVLAFDIEVYTRKGMPDPKEDPIISISIITNYGYKKLLIFKKIPEKIKKNYPFVEECKSERELLQKFVEIIKKENPAIIVTYNGDNFDFKYIRERAKILKVKLSIGFNDSEPKLVKKGKDFATKIEGRVHIDLYPFVSTILAPSLQTPTYTLDAVANELLGERKLEIDWDLFMENWIRADEKFLEEFIKYSFRDAELTIKLFIHLADFIFELSRILNLPIFDVVRFSYSNYVDQYLLKNIRKFDEIAPKKPDENEKKRRVELSYEGAFVYEPKPGLYENVVVFDFRSLYPSIIITFNISPDTVNKESCKNNAYYTPPIERGGRIIKHWFCKEPKGFIPAILKEVYDKRVELKKKLKKLDKRDPLYKKIYAEQLALKTILNATYGYMGFASSRYYSLECAEAITAFGRYYIKKTIEFFESKGLKVIYGDTDSLFLYLGNKSLNYALKILEEWNNQLPGYLELEFDKFYRRIIFVPKKSGEGGAKKKYAAITEKGDIIIKGFEAVRRDWAELIKEAQIKVLEYILKDGNPKKAYEYIRELIKELKEYKIPLEKLVIYEKLTKRLDEYLASAPHVSAARKLQQLGYKIEPGFIVRYVITKGGGNVSDRAYPLDLAKKLNLKYDPDYYIDKQLIPAVERILATFGYTTQLLLGKGKQKTLFDFFSRK